MENPGEAMACISTTASNHTRRALVDLPTATGAQDSQDSQAQCLVALLRKPGCLRANVNRECDIRPDALTR
jgi:hypothetical protein